MSANETAVFTLTAQVYALDKTQKWTPLTQEVIPVVFLLNESTGVTRIHAVDKGVVVINSTILANMQYRRPSETFVQWFDSQHILYGLNLTSVLDADNFEKEFDAATKSSRKPTASQLAVSPTQSAISGPATPTAPSRFKAAGDVNMTSASNGSLNAGNNESTSQSAASNGAKQMAAKESSFTGTSEVSSREPTMSADRLVTSFGKPPVTDSKTAEAKSAAALKARVKELELQSVTMQAEKSQLHETIASQSKTISGLQKQITMLEADIDKLKTAFQQNSGNVGIWKQQLQTYQDVNDQLTTKMTELTEIYEKFGDILRRD